MIFIKNNLKSLLLWSLMLFIFLYFSLWLVTIPFDGAPDEELRYMIPKFIYQYGELPTGYDAEVIYREGYYSYAFYPQYLGALVSAFLMKLPELLLIKGLSLLHLARLTSVFSGMGLAFVLGKTAERLTGRFSIRLLTMAGLAFWPQITFLSSYVNNDIIGLFGVAVIVDSMIAVAKRKDWLLRDTIELSLGYILCLLGYINTYSFVLFSGFYFLAMLYLFRKRQGRPITWLINHCLILALIMAVLVLPFFMRNYLLYQDIFGNTVFEARNQQWLQEGHKATMFPYTGGDFYQFLISTSFWEMTVKSFIGYFGYMMTPMSDLEYSIYLVVTLLGLFGFMGLSLVKVFRRKCSLEMCGFALGVFLSSLVTLFLFLYRSYYVDYQAQGRYIIAIIIPLFLMVVVAYAQVLAKLPRKWFLALVALAILLLFLQNLDIYHDYIYHVYIELGRTR